MNRLTAFVAAAAILFFLSMGGMSIQAGTEDEGPRILNLRCTQCHDLRRVENANKNRHQWENTVDRMRLIGSRISPDEKAVLIDYLVR